MITTKQILNYIEGELNSISILSDYGIVFNGEQNFYNHEWVKQKFSIDVTPFVLVTNRFNVERGGTEGINFRYTIAAIPFKDDREKVRDIFNILQSSLKYAEIDGYKFDFIPQGFDLGADFSEGSGRGKRRFEAIFEFEGRANNALGNEDIILTLDNQEVFVNSLRYDHVKANFANEKEVDTNINGEMLIIETILKSGDTAIFNILNKIGKSSSDIDILLKINNQIVANNTLYIENYTISSDKTSNTISVFLYFRKEAGKKYIKIGNGNEIIKVLNYALVSVSNIEGHRSPDDNTSTALWLGRTRGYSFSVEEDYNNQTILNLMDAIYSDEESSIPLYDVEINHGTKSFNKKLLLSEITDDGNGVLTLSFLDGSELDG